MRLATKPTFVAIEPVRAEAWSNDGMHFVSLGDDRGSALSINVESARYAHELAGAINAVADMHRAPKLKAVG